MKHRTTVNILMLLWGCCTYRLAFSATFAQEVFGWDYVSLLTAVIAGLCGGALRTIYTLSSDDRAVFEILKEARKDLVISCLAGGTAYFAMVAIESKWPGTITAEIRFVGVLAAGWTRSAIFTQASRLVRARIDGKADELRGRPEDPPASAPVPLEK